MAGIILWWCSFFVIGLVLVFDGVFYTAKTGRSVFYFTLFFFFWSVPVLLLLVGYMREREEGGYNRGLLVA